MINRQMCVLLRHQLGATDVAFQAVYKTTYDHEARALSFDNFIDQYLMEAADTMVNINFPVVAQQPFEIPKGIDGSREKYGPLILRGCFGYSVWHDRHFMQFDMLWSPEC